MRRTHGQYFTFWLFGLAAAVIGTNAAFSSEPRVGTDASVVATFIAIGVLSYGGLAHALTRDGLSLRTIYWYFTFTFFFVVPFVQYRTDRWMYPVAFHDLAYVNSLILLFMVSFGFGTRIARHWHTRPAKPQIRVNRYVVSRWPLYAFCSLSVSSAAVLAATSDVNSLLLRSQAGISDAIRHSSPLVLLAQYGLRPFALMAFLFAVYHAVGKRRVGVADMVLLAITGSAAALLNFPTATARFYAFSVILLVVALVFPPSARRAGLYLVILTIGTLASATFNSSRTATSLTGLQVRPFNVEYLLEGHFDAYEVLVHGVNYVASEGNRFGGQLLGSLLFWVPRSVWPSKPISTSTMIYSDYLSSYTNIRNSNVASPMVLEFYVDFHVWGLVAGALIVGFAVAALDSGWRDLQGAIGEKAIKRGGILTLQASPLYAFLYPLLIGFFLFILRGPLLSATAYTAGVIAAFLVFRVGAVRRVSEE